MTVPVCFRCFRDEADRLCRTKRKEKYHKLFQKCVFNQIVQHFVSMQPVKQNVRFSNSAGIPFFDINLASAFVAFFVEEESLLFNYIFKKLIPLFFLQTWRHSSIFYPKFSPLCCSVDLLFSDELKVVSTA